MVSEKLIWREMGPGKIPTYSLFKRACALIIEIIPMVNVPKIALQGRMAK